MREEASKQVAQVSKDGLIKPSTSPLASPVFLERKNNGSMRFCIEYRKLNAVTTKDACPLPRIDDTLDAFNGADCFSRLDLASGYLQVGIEEEAEKKSATVCGEGLYQFKVMPFSLVNTPATFERLMERVLSGLQLRRAFETLRIRFEKIGGCWSQAKACEVPAYGDISDLSRSCGQC